MTDYGTIKLPRGEYEQHNKKRKEMNLTWAEYVANEAPTNQREQTIDVEDARILSQHLEKAIAPYFEEMNQTVELEATTINQIAKAVANELR